MRFLSDDWLDAADSALASVSVPPDARLTIEQSITGAPAGKVVYHLVCGDGSCRLARGPADEPHLRFTEDYATAAAIAQGQRSAQEAFMTGDLKLDGAVVDLLRQAEVIDAVGAAIASVREDTQF